MGGLDILNGKLTVDIDGNVFIAAHLTVGGGLTTNEIRPMGEGDLTINLENEGEQPPEMQFCNSGGCFPYIFPINFILSAFSPLSRSIFLS